MDPSAMGKKSTGKGRHFNAALTSIPCPISTPDERTLLFFPTCFGSGIVVSPSLEIQKKERATFSMIFHFSGRGLESFSFPR
jgi:hypothetical protein